MKVTGIGFKYSIVTSSEIVRCLNPMLDAPPPDTQDCFQGKWVELRKLRDSPPLSRKSPISLNSILSIYPIAK